MFGHRVTKIGALHAPFDNRYSWFQIKSVRDARTQSDPRQCVHLRRYFYLSPAISERFFQSVPPSLPRNPRFCQTPPAIPLSSHCQLHTGPVHVHPSHTLSTFLKTHYITHPTHPRASYNFHRACAVPATRRVALRNRNFPRKCH